MGAMIETARDTIHAVTLNAPHLEVRVLYDEELDQRRERFFEGISRLIWDERFDETRKEQVLRRYARIRQYVGDAWFAQTAQQLAETYAAAAKQFH